MADDLASALGWVANYSSFYSVLTVIICFVLMVIFILRLNGDLLLSAPATHHRIVEEQRMLPLTNPFSVHLMVGKTSSIKEGVYLDVSVLDSTLFAAVLGVSIPAFQQEINLSCGEIAQRYQDKTMFDSKYMEYKDLGQLDPEAGHSTLYVPCPPAVTETTLGDTPRTVYPIVIVTVRKKPDISLDYTAIVLQFTVLHLKDTICSLDSHIVYQFLKTNHNQILSLQPIFVSVGDSYSSTMYSSGTQNQTQSAHQSSSEQNSLHDTSFKQVSQNDSAVTEDSAACTCKIPNSSATTIDTSENITCSSSRKTYHGASCSNEVQSEEENSSSITEPCNLCVVCQNAPVFYTLLLCRHACVCYSCIKLLDRCPMCRGLIDSYFRLDNAPEPELRETSEDDNSGPRLPWWEALNNRFNHILGFE